MVSHEYRPVARELDGEHGLRSDSSVPVLLRSASAVGLTFSLVATGWVLPARADNEAIGRVLFSEGMAFIAKGQLAAGCEKLDGSARLFPGVGALFYLGDCKERLGRVASAWTHFMRAANKANTAGDSARAEEAYKRAAQLEPRLPRVTLRTTVATPGLEVRLDGEMLAPGVLGTALPVDPGPHTLEVSAPGKDPWSTKVVLDLAQKQDVKIPELKATAAPIQTSPVPLPPPPDHTTRRTVGYVLGGAGALGLLAGGVLGGRAHAQYSEALTHCRGAQCTSDGIDLASSAKAFALSSNVTFALGGAALATGLVLVVISLPATGPARTAVRGWSVGVSPRGVSLGGVF